jgi:hypothetical protein
MHLSGKKKEMLFILGMFFSETDRKFSQAPLSVSVSKAEFIDVIKSLSAVSKKERAIYKNLEELQKEKFVIYNERELLLSRRGFNEYEAIINEMKNLDSIASKIEAQRIIFKRKVQTKLK